MGDVLGVRLDKIWCISFIFTRIASKLLDQTEKCCRKYFFWIYIYYFFHYISRGPFSCVNKSKQPFKSYKRYQITLPTPRMIIKCKISLSLCCDLQTIIPLQVGHFKMVSVNLSRQKWNNRCCFFFNWLILFYLFIYYLDQWSNHSFCICWACPFQLTDFRCFTE